jgi:antitoxin component of RelBE/YafQ-DinJ toxin-antitoxin module
MTTLTLRIDANLKLELQEMAKNLGLSLNQLMNLNIRDFVKKKELNISLENKVEFEDFSENEIELLENE